MARAGQLRQGRATASSISAPRMIRSVAVPWAPRIGNSDLAIEAPPWNAAVATSTAAIGSRMASVAARGVLAAKGSSGGTGYRVSARGRERTS